MGLGQSRSDTGTKAPDQEPHTAEIIPRAGDLAIRLKILETRIKTGPDISAIEEKYNQLEAELNNFSNRFQRLKDSGDYRYTTLMELKEIIKQKGIKLAAANRPLDLAIRQIDLWRNEWLAEQNNWTHWQSSLAPTEQPGQLQSAFREANTTIDTALNRIAAQMETLLAVQAKAARIQVKINAFAYGHL
jgi:chromosome segregation ATPase